MGDGDRPDGILGRLVPPPPERRVPASSVDVLLVRGDERFTSRVTALLRRHAYSVVEAPAPGDALATVRGGCQPRLVVVDLDGASAGDRSALAALQAEPGCGHASFLALSRTGDEALPGLRLAASLLKPLDAAELVEAVRRLCGAG